jgi:hypothetical protein
VRSRKNKRNHKKQAHIWLPSLFSCKTASRFQAPVSHPIANSISSFPHPQSHSFGLGLLRFSVAAIVILFSIPVLAQTPPDSGYITVTGSDATVELNFDSITLDLALLLKVRADEFFIQSGPNDRAGSKYAAALEELKKVRPENLPVTGRNVLALLKQDIEYRQLLLSNKFSFWGGFRSMTPSLPAQIQEEFAENVTNLGQVVREIYDLQNFQVANEKVGAEANAKSIKSSADIAVHRVEGEIQAIQGQESRLSRQDTLVRMQSLRSQRAALEGEMERASKALAAAQKSVDNALIGAAANYAGLPPGTADAIITGDIKGAIIKYATSESFLNSPEIASAGQQLGKLGTQLTEVIHTANEVRSKLEDAEFVRTAIRDPSLKNLSSLGERAWSNLPTESKDEILRRVSEQAPVAAIVDLARDGQNIYNTAASNVASLRNGLASGLAQLDSISSLAQANAQAAIDRLGNNETQLKNATANLLHGLSEEIGRGSSYVNRAADSYVRLSSKALLASVKIRDPQVVDELKKAFHVNTEEEIAASLSSLGISQSSHLEVKAKDLILRRAGKDLVIGDVGTLLSQVNANTVSVSSTDVKKELTSLTVNLGQTSTSVRNLVLQNIDPALFPKLANDSLANLSQGELRTIWDRTMQVTKSQSSGASDWATSEVAKLAVGELSGHGVVEANDNDAALPPPPPNSSGSNSSGNNDALAKQAATTALNAAFPGAGTAAQVLMSAIEGMAEMGRQIENMQRLSASSRALFMEESQLAASLNPLLLQEAIATKQLQIAKLQQQASQQQADLYMQIVAASGTETKDLWTRVKMRRPLAFYRAELLREQYSLLDDAIGVWAGTETTLSKNIERMVRNDPQNLRLALDSEIDLYGWFNRDLEGSRTDLDQLEVHWRQLDAVASEALKPIMGGGGGSPLGSIQTTDRLSLRSLIAPGSDDARALESWLQNPSSGTALRFLLHPAQRFFGANLRNIRVIDVALSGIIRGASPQEFTVISATLKHPGAALVSNSRSSDGQSVRPYRWEVLVPANLAIVKKISEISPTQYLTPFRLKSAGARAPIEGYSPFTVWQLSISDSFRTLPKLDDLELKIIYYSIDDDAIVTEQDFLNSIDRRRSSSAPDLAWVQNYFPVSWYRWTASRVGNKSQAVGLSESYAAMLLDYMPAAPASDQQRPAGVAACAVTRQVAASQSKECPPPVDLIVQKRCLPKSEISASLYEYYRSDDFLKKNNPKSAQICAAVPRGWDGSTTDSDSIRKNASRLAECAIVKLTKTRLCAQ